MFRGRGQKYNNMKCIAIVKILGGQDYCGGASPPSLLVSGLPPPQKKEIFNLYH